MMLRTKKNTMRSLATCVLIVLAFLCTEAFAALPQGTWTFERSLDYFGRTPVNQAPRFTKIVVRDKTVSLSDTCLASFNPDLYLFSDIFQPLTKQSITDKQVDNFLMKNFKMSLLKTTEVYSLTSSPQNCADQVMEFFVVDDRLLIPVGATFYSYVKSGNGAATGTTAASSYSGYKQSRLPMDFDRYYASCKPKIMSAKGRPQTSDKCAPDFFPYVADPASNDELMKIVGNHYYSIGGQEYTSGFSPPFKQKTPATFLVFAPMQHVTLVRVDDFEVVRNESRDVMTGVYLSILGGKVIDQISGCHFNRDYVCIEEGRQVAKLSPDGRFVRL